MNPEKIFQCKTLWLRHSYRPKRHQHSIPNSLCQQWLQIVKMSQHILHNQSSGLSRRRYLWKKCTNWRNESARKTICWDILRAIWTWSDSRKWICSKFHDFFLCLLQFIHSSQEYFPLKDLYKIRFIWLLRTCKMIFWGLHISAETWIRLSSLSWFIFTFTTFVFSWYPLHLALKKLLWHLLCSCIPSNTLDAKFLVHIHLPNHEL